MLTISGLSVRGTSGFRRAGDGGASASGARVILDEISLAVHAGECCAVIGPNGAGKSTFIKTIAGLIAPCAGAISFQGREVLSGGICSRSRCVAYLPQNTMPVPCSVFDAVLLGRRPCVNWRLGTRDRELTGAVLAELGLTHLASECVTRLSGGEFQKVLIARALVQDAPVLLLDEPVNHLDIQNQVAILDMVRTQTVRRGMATMIVLHDLDFALRYADSVLLLHKGRSQYWGSAAQLPEEALTATYGIPVTVREFDGRQRVLF